MFDPDNAQDIYEDLRSVSRKILTAHGCEVEPHKPVVRTRRFRYGKPRGILFHYTGGTTTHGPMCWGNKPSWGNTGSSWHVLIADRVPDSKIGDLWLEHASKAVLDLFEVPVIVMADFRYGTWHGNWTNDLTLGVENRNAGYSGRLDPTGDRGRLGAVKCGKQAEFVSGKTWERFSREQLWANVVLGRLVNAMYGLNRRLLLPHHAVWAVKSDPGPLFPMHEIRRAIFSELEKGQCKWLVTHPGAPKRGGLGEPHSLVTDSTWYGLGDDGPRIERSGGELDGKINVSDPSTQSEAERVAMLLWRLGFDARPHLDGAPPLAGGELGWITRWFQRSTESFKWSKTRRGTKPLVCDGVFGPLTESVLLSRLTTLGL